MIIFNDSFYSSIAWSIWSNVCSEEGKKNEKKFVCVEQLKNQDRFESPPKVRKDGGTNLMQKKKLLMFCYNLWIYKFVSRKTCFGKDTLIVLFFWFLLTQTHTHKNLEPIRRKQFQTNDKFSCWGKNDSDENSHGTPTYHSFRSLLQYIKGHLTDTHGSLKPIRF